jgi:diguanylate cyclase (GGDEF)-like protein
MKNFKIISVLILIISIISINIAHSKVINYKFKNLKSTDKMLSNDIFDIRKHSSGFIWFATSAGVSRFDGINFLNYNYAPGEKNHISNNLITSISEDKDKNIWISTEGGVNVIDSYGKVHEIKAGIKSGLTSNWITDVFIDSKNRVWLSTGEGLFLKDKDNYKFTKYSVDNDTYYKVIEDNLGNIYSHGFKDVFRVNIDKKIAEKIKFSEDIQGTISASINLLYTMKDNRIAIGTEENGLIIINEDMSLSKIYNKKNGLYGNDVSAIYNDKSGNIWVGHYSNGISIIDTEDKVLNARHDNYDFSSISGNNINSIKEFDGIIWIGTNNGISKYSIKNNDSKIFYESNNDNGLSSSIINSSSQFSKDEFLISTEKGIDIIDLKNLKVSKKIMAKLSLDKIFDGQIYSISVSGDNVWMSLSSGIAIYNVKENTIKLYSNKIGNKYNLPNGEYYTLTLDDKGGAYLTGVYGIGVIYFDSKKEKAIRFMADENNKYNKDGNFSSQLIVSENNSVIMSTTDGVFKLNTNDDSYTHYSIGKVDEFIRTYSIVEINKGEFWVATEGLGLISLKINNPDNFEINNIKINKKGKEKQLYYLEKREDFIWAVSKDEVIKISIVNPLEINIYKNLFPVDNINFAHSTLKIYNNDLFIHSENGLFVVDLDKLKQSDLNPPIRITGFKSDGIDINNGFKDNESIEVDGLNIKFSFASLDYSNPMSNEFSYKLEGFDDEWHNSDNNFAMYSNLFPGKYKFLVKGTNSDGIWSNSIAEYEINIKTPFLYYVIGILFLIILILMIIYLISRNKQMNLLDKKAHTDALTKLSNRLDFQRIYENQFYDKNNEFALIVIDLDYFKDINDAYGHSVGDKYIKEAANRMIKSVRDRDYIARLGGDEFVIIINKFKLSENVKRISERLHSILSDTYFVNNQELKGSASIGVAIYPEHGVNHEELFIHADAAMYEAKSNGRNQVIYFDEELKNKLKKSIRVKALLRSALDNNEFVLYYQPKLSIDNKKLSGFEALIRWIHPEDGIIPPDQFIPEAEKNGSIVEIGEWVINQACDQAVLWSKCGFKGNIAVNISAVQLVKGDVVKVVRDAIIRSGIEPSKLEIEITESSLMDNVGKSKIILNNLKSLGVSIALDDFGTGYSSLSYLTKFPIDTLKIDRSFISDAEKEDTSFYVLENIYSLARKLGMTIVSEGIENSEQENMLKEFNDHQVQGFLYSRPLPAEEVKEMIGKEFRF